MVNILEICLTELVKRKNLLEGELERIVNSETIDTETKFSRSLELIEKISSVYNSIELTGSYITKNKNNEDGKV